MVGNVGWRLLNGGKKERLNSIDSVLDYVRHHYPTVKVEASTGNYKSYWVDGQLVALSWGVLRHKTDWWCAIKNRKEGNFYG